MTIANSDTKALKRHLFRCHVRFDTILFPGLSHDELRAVHEAFHEDGWSSHPHSHAADFSVEYHEDYVKSIVEGVMESRKDLEGEVSSR